MAQIWVHNSQHKEWVELYIKLGCPVALASIWYANTKKSPNEEILQKLFEIEGLPKTKIAPFLEKFAYFEKKSKVWEHFSSQNLLVFKFFYKIFLFGEYLQRKVLIFEYIILSTKNE